MAVLREVVRNRAAQESEESGSGGTSRSKAVPDLRPLMQQAPPDELSELFAAFDLTATYDKSQQALRLAATLSADLIPPREAPLAAKNAVGEIFHSGGGIWTHFPDAFVYRFTEIHAL